MSATPTTPESVREGFTRSPWCASLGPFVFNSNAELDAADQASCEALSALHAANVTNPYSLDGSSNANVRKKPFDGTLFHDNPRKEAARAYAGYIHPVLDVKTDFLTASEMNDFDLSTIDSYTLAMLFEGDDDCKARARLAAGYEFPVSEAPKLTNTVKVETLKVVASHQLAPERARN